MTCGQGIFRLDGSYKKLSSPESTPSTNLDASPMNISRTKSQEARAKALLELIEAEMGPSSCRETVFDVQKLEM